MRQYDAFERVAATEGIDPCEVARRLEQALLEAVQDAWGLGRAFEASFDPAEGVRIYQVVRVVERVDPARARSEVDQATARERFGAELGDELLVQVHYRDEDAAAARLQLEAFEGLPSLEELAGGLPLPGGPEWLRALWPGRRRPWRWGLPVALPSLADAMGSLERWVRARVPGALRGAGSPPEELEQVRTLGPAAAELVPFYERFGPTESCAPLGLLWTLLEPPPAALARRATMTELAAAGALADRTWSDAWLPVFDGQGGTAYCLDLEGTLGGAAGQVVRWVEDEPERRIEAPSFGAWIGLIALAVDFELLRWDERDGVVLDGGEAFESFAELHRHVLPGYPRAFPDGR